MWNDIETTEDYLHFSVVAETVSELIVESNGSPISIGVSGNWGAGKSSMVKMIGKELEKRDKKNSEELNKYVFLEFNAWLYQGYDDARTALLQVISDKLNCELEKRASDSAEISAKIKKFTKRINWLQVAKIAAPLAVGLIPGAAPVGAIASLIGSVANSVKDKNGKKENGDEINTSINNLSSEFKDLLKEESVKSMPQQIEELRREFADILKALEITLVILVDDLDRCLPSTAISTLEAMRLLLFVPNTAFIIAADEQMIRNGVKAHFNDVELTEGLVTSYFDKLIQIPLTVPYLGVPEIKAYIILLFAEMELKRENLTQEAFDEAKKKIQTFLCDAWRDGLAITKLSEAFDSSSLEAMQQHIEMADQLAKILVEADNIKGNPRLIKRFLNALRIREKIAKINSITVDYNCLVKMLLFERCASTGAFEYLIKEVKKSENGKPLFISKIEADLKEGKEYEAPDTTWKSDFIKNWMALEPCLGDYDIRPLLYLSRDRSLSIAAYDELSPEARDVLEALEKVELGVILPMLTDKIKAIGETEAGILLNRIIRLGRTNQWQTTTLYAALHITEVFPDLGTKLVMALEGIPAKARKPAYVPVLKDKSWAAKMLENWKDDKDTPSNVAKSIKL